MGLVEVQVGSDYRIFVTFAHLIGSTQPLFLWVSPGTSLPFFFFFIFT